MKKIALFLVPAAVALMAAGCSVVELETVQNEEPVKEEILIHKTFLAGTADTRTTLEGTKVLFAEGEGISIYDGSGNREFTANEAGSNVSFSGDVSATATEFYALSPYSASTIFTRSGSTVTAKTTLPAVQEATPGSFENGVNISAAKASSSDSFSLENVLSIAKFTLSSANLGGHQIASVEFTSTYPLAGDVVVTYGESCSAAGGTNTVNKVTLSHADGSVLADGTYYIAVLPNAGGEIALKFTDSEGCIATKTATLKSAFEAGSIKNLGTVKGLNWVAPKRYFEKVTSNNDLGEGEYLIVYESGSSSVNVLSGKSSGGEYGDYEEVTIAEGKISYDDADSYVIRVSQGTNGYVLKQGDYYLGYTGSDNKLYFNNAFTARQNEWTIDIVSGSDATIANVGTSARIIKWNSQSPRFACYKSGQSAVKLYKLSGPSVKTGSVTDLTVSTATLHASFSNLGTTNVQNVHFVYGTSPESMTNTIGAQDLDISSGEFHATLGSLAEATRYYYQAILQYYDGSTYVELKGSVQSFVTYSSSTGGNSGLQWLGCYEVPLVSLVNNESYSDSGNERFGSTKWYNYLTTTSTQKVITHTYSYNGRVYRNYTALIDKDRRCPLWTAQVMHSGAYPDNNVGRAGSFSESTSYDPGIDKDWQSSGATYNYNNGNGYSRGHHCASSDRQTTADANKQTFYYTNQSPQWYNGFNGSIWNDLENAIQNNVPSGHDTLYVVTGTLFEGDRTWPSNDGGVVGLPSHFYKCLLKCSFDNSGRMTSAEGIAYLYTNESHAGKHYYDDSFVKTINDIESLSGFTFFSNVPSEYLTSAKQSKVPLW